VRLSGACGGGKFQTGRKKERCMRNPSHQREGEVSVETEEVNGTKR